MPPSSLTSPNSKAFALALENQDLSRKLELLGGTDAAELLDLNAENQEVIAEQEKELKALRSKVKELEAQQSNNSSISESLNKFKDEAEQKIASTIVTQRTRMEELEAEKVQLGDDLAAKVAEIGDLKITQSETVDTMSVSIGNLQESNDSKDELISSLSAQVETLTSTLSSDSACRAEEETKLTSEINSLKLQLSLQESAVKELMDSNVQLVEEKHTSNRENLSGVESLKSKLLSTEDERDALLGDNEELKGKVIEGDGRAVKAEEMVEELNKENGRLGEKNEKLNRKVKKLESSLSSTDSSLAQKVKSQSDYIASQLSKAKKVRNALREANNNNLMNGK